MMKASQRPRILRASAATLLALVLSSPMVARAQTTYTWTGAVNNQWETAGNWNKSGADLVYLFAPPSGPTPGTDANDDPNLVFQGSRNTNTVNNLPTIFGNDDIQTITFAPNAAKFSLSGSAIFMDGGGFIINNSPNLQVISFSPSAFTGGAGIELSSVNFNSAPPIGTIIPFFHITAASGDILVTSSISFASTMTLFVDGSHNVTITGSLFNLVGGNVSLVKNGTGTLLLDGNNTYTGSTTVNGGTLGGTGIIGGNLFNFANVQPGDAPGTFTVKGNYYQSHTGTLTIQVTGGNASNHSTLAVQKSANLDGTLRIVKIGSGALLKVGQKIDIVTANQGVDGTFSDVTFQGDTLFNAQVVYSADAVSLEQSSSAFEQIPGLTPNELAVAQALDKAASRNHQAKLLDFLDAEPVRNLPGDFDRIAPEELTSIFTIGTALANVQSTNLQRRTDDIRSGSHGFSAAGFATAGSGPLYSGNMGLAGPSGNDGKESKEMKTVVPPEERWGAFITGVGEWVSVGDDFNARGYDITTGGFTLGADYKVTPNFAIGIDAGYAGTGADLTNGGRIWVNGGKLGLYATFFQNQPAAAPTMSKDSSKEAPAPAPSIAGGFYADVAVTGGYNSYDTRRDALQGTARGSTEGGELNVLFGAGYDWKMGALSIGPTATFQYTYLGIRDFSESGSLAPLSFPSQHQDSLRTAFGMKASYDWKIGGVIVKPELRAAWQHEYGDASYALESSLEGAGGPLFTVNGPKIGRDSLLLGAGFAVMLNERTSTYVYYDGELARTRFDSQNVSGGIRISF
jgi:autotransporter-associated beta strand protein